MKKHLILIVAVTFALMACGGGEPEPLPSEPASYTEQSIGGVAYRTRCNGTPSTAIVYLGDVASFPELATVADACIFATSAEGLSAERARILVNEAKRVTAQPRVSIIGLEDGSMAALNFMGAHPGHVGFASLWHGDRFDVAGLSGLRGSLVSIYLNAGVHFAECDAAATLIRGQGTFATCKAWPANFDAGQRAEALVQIHLELTR